MIDTSATGAQEETKTPSRKYLPSRRSQEDAQNANNA